MKRQAQWRQNLPMKHPDGRSMRIRHEHMTLKGCEVIAEPGQVVSVEEDRRLCRFRQESRVQVAVALAQENNVPIIFTRRGIPGNPRTPSMGFQPLIQAIGISARQCA